MLSNNREVDVYNNNVVSSVQIIPVWAMEDWSARQTSWKRTRLPSPRILTLSGQYRSGSESTTLSIEVPLCTVVHKCNVPVLSHVFHTKVIYLTSTGREVNIFCCIRYCKPDIMFMCNLAVLVTRFGIWLCALYKVQLWPCLVKSFRYCNTFVFIWQILSNHELIRLKKIHLTSLLQSGTAGAVK